MTWSPGRAPTSASRVKPPTLPRPVQRGPGAPASMIIRVAECTPSAPTSRSPGAPEELRIALIAPACGASRPSSVCVLGLSLLGVGLVLSFGAVADVPDVAIRVGEGSAVPAPLQLRRRLEDLPAGLLGLVQDFVDAVFAAHDVIEDDAAEAAA